MNQTVQIVVLAIIQKKGKYLFTLRHDPGSDYHNKWQIPGGGHEFAETTEETLHREVREELGTEVVAKQLIPFVDTKVRGSWQGIFITYLCELKDANSPIILNEEATAYRWMNIDELREVDTLPGCMELFESWI